jgi:hypothetical protein
MLEHCYAIERQVTGRRGPAFVNVEWRENPHSALAICGRASGGQVRRCWLPFHGYEEKNDPFNVTRFVPHEMLHTFGYHHSDEMYHLQKLVNLEFSRYRWFMVDHPEAAPAIVQGVPADAVDKKPVAKKKKGHKKKS